MKNIQTVLQFTSQEYEEMVFGFWMRWVESVTIDHKEFLKVFSNAKVHRWFMAELENCEAEFRLLTSRYHESKTISLKDYQKCYGDCTFKMFSIFPKALLFEAKKSTDKSLQGIPVNKLTITQN